MPLLSIMTRRDFGPLLDAEIEFLQENHEKSSRGRDSPRNSGAGLVHHGGEDLENLEEDELGNTSFDAPSSLVTPLMPVSINDGREAVKVKDNGDDNESLDVPPRWINAIVPFSVLIVTTFVGIFVSGSSACTTQGISHPSLVQVVAHADSVDALLWAAAAASFVCVLLYACQRLMTLEDLMGAWTSGFKDMMEPLLILMLAWALGGVVGDLKTSSFSRRGSGWGTCVRFGLRPWPHCSRASSRLQVVVPWAPWAFCSPSVAAHELASIV